MKRGRATSWQTRAVLELLQKVHMPLRKARNTRYDHYSALSPLAKRSAPCGAVSSPGHLSSALQSSRWDGKIGGSKTRNLGQGFFARSPEERLADCSKGGRTNVEGQIGLWARTSDQHSRDSNRGGNSAFEQKKGFHAMSKEDKKAVAQRSGATVMRKQQAASTMGLFLQQAYSRNATLGMEPLPRTSTQRKPTRIVRQRSCTASKVTASLSPNIITSCQHSYRVQSAALRTFASTIFLDKIS